jgi:hypothetical protein
MQLGCDDEETAGELQLGLEELLELSLNLQ